MPLILKKPGADPVLASSIFLTTATNVASMALLLGLASLLVKQAPYGVRRIAARRGGVGGNCGVAGREVMG